MGIFDDEIVSIFEDEDPENGRTGDLPHSQVLTLEITDRPVIRYLSKFHMYQRKGKALEALRLGVFAIQSAGSALDASIVEDSFREILQKMESSLAEYFRGGDGMFPKAIQELTGEGGALTRLPADLALKFGSILDERIGPGSDFSRKLDPGQKESVVSHLESVVQQRLESTLAKLQQEFSLDREGSSISRLQTSLAHMIGELRTELWKYLSAMKSELEFEKGRQTEAVRGTAKGRKFQDLIYEFVAENCRYAGDMSEDVSNSPGKLGRSKKGDSVVMLGVASAAPGLRIVIEAKNERGIRMKDVIAELDEAKKNREAEIGIFVFARGQECPEIGNFLRIGNDFYISVDQENYPASAIYLEAALALARGAGAAMARSEKSESPDLDLIYNEINSLSEEIQQLSEAETKMRTIGSNSKLAEEIIARIRGGVGGRLKKLLPLLKMDSAPGKIEAMSGQRFPDEA